MVCPHVCSVQPNVLKLARFGLRHIPREVRRFREIRALVVIYTVTVGLGCWLAAVCAGAAAGGVFS